MVAVNVGRPPITLGLVLEVTATLVDVPAWTITVTALDVTAL
jgi:hypothetical protein